MIVSQPRLTTQARKRTLSQRKLMTVAALKAILFCLACELVFVDWLGGLLMHRVGLDEGYLTPLSIVAYAGAGFLAHRRGAYGAVAGAIVTTTDVVGWMLSGNLAEQTDSGPIRFVTAWILLLVAIAGGGLLGAIGGWIAGRSQRASEPTPAT